MFEAFDHDGFLVVEGAVPTSNVNELSPHIDALLSGLGRVRGGVRDLFARCPAVRPLASSQIIRRIVEPVVGSDCIAVNATLFDKADSRNWKVPYHQDVTVRLKSRKDVSGFDPWWEKDGVPHVWPPAAILERMLAVRIHLDDCGPENGPLRVIPASHRGGVLTSEQIDQIRDRGPEVMCNIGAGGVLLMRPLLLHASSNASNPTRRRVIHLEYAPPELPGGLEWYDWVAGVSN